MTVRLAAVAAAALLALAAPPASALQNMPGAADTNPSEAIAAPVPVTIRTGELQALLENAAWIGKGTGRIPFYTVGFRSCPDCVSMHVGAFDKLENSGADIRAILYARPDQDGKARSKPGERAMIAELWKTRSYNLYHAWYETDPDTFYKEGNLPPSADIDLQRKAMVEKSRKFLRDLQEILAANNLPLYVPVSFWKENGQWMAYVGYNPQTFDQLVIARLSGF